MKAEKNTGIHAGQITLFDLLETQPDVPPKLVVQPNISSLPNQFNISDNHILRRKNVFYCTRNRSEYNNYKFDHHCELTGEQWSCGVWESKRDYEKNPVIYPCKQCEHAKCEWCVFNKKEQKPYGCCGSCAHREGCEESQWRIENDKRKNQMKGVD